MNFHLLSNNTNETLIIISFFFPDDLELDFKVNVITGLVSDKHGKLWGIINGIIYQHYKSCPKKWRDI
ncbi:hypothetical protein RCL_jg23719.t1 [Rhizophagus clarus]|uniref:Uncharacterized protein n=1 Tax=Rhizophagus clarus TaxID=94130 RepID=A0A8H3QS77_9GLOM|nr:hypothetical protein RCL_jg23719.t1 [Rhizophagus clarus]